MEKIFTSGEFTDIDGGHHVVIGRSGLDRDTDLPYGEIEVGRPGGFYGIDASVRLTSAEEVEGYLAWHRTSVRAATRAAGLLPEEESEGREP
jgi:hypothetical protein